MKPRRRIYYNSEQRNLMWDRWQKGDSMHAIARLFDRGHSSVQGILSETGGIRPTQRTLTRGLIRGRTVTRQRFQKK